MAETLPRRARETFPRAIARASLAAASASSRRQLKTTSSTEPPTPKMNSFRMVILLSLAILFDFLKAIFALFLFVGPALIGLAAGLASSNALGVGSFVSSAIGAAVGGIALVFGGPELEAFGMVMAMAVAFIGNLLFFWLFFGWGMFKGRGWQQVVRFMISWIIGEVPIVDAMPTFTPMVAFAIVDVRRGDREAQKKYEMAQTEAQRLRQEQERSYVLQLQQQHALQESEQEDVEDRLQQEAANDTHFNGSEAANDSDFNAEDEIPSWQKKAA